MKQAKADLATWRLASPRGNNALEKYEEVLSLDPSNQDAQLGIQTIADRYVQLVYRDLTANRIERARYYLGRASHLAPDADNVKKAKQAWLVKSKETKKYSASQRLREFRQRYSGLETDQKASDGSNTRSDDFKGRIGGDWVQ